MSRTLGVSCSPTAALVTLLVDGVAEAQPDRLPWPVADENERLRIMEDQFTDLLRELRVEKVAVLLPERDPRYKWAYETAADRASMETLIRLAAVRVSIAVELLRRDTVRSRLQITGKLDSHLESLIAPAGTYWRPGRGEAALAALAAERG